MADTKGQPPDSPVESFSFAFGNLDNLSPLDIARHLTSPALLSALDDPESDAVKGMAAINALLASDVIGRPCKPMTDAAALSARHCLLDVEFNTTKSPGAQYCLLLCTLWLLKLQLECDVFMAQIQRGPSGPQAGH